MDKETQVNGEKGTSDIKWQMGLAFWTGRCRWTFQVYYDDVFTWLHWYWVTRWCPFNNYYIHMGLIIIGMSSQLKQFSTFVPKFQASNARFSHPLSCDESKIRDEVSSPVRILIFMANVSSSSKIIEWTRRQYAEIAYGDNTSAWVSMWTSHPYAWLYAGIS